VGGEASRLGEIDFRDLARRTKFLVPPSEGRQGNRQSRPRQLSHRYCRPQA